MADTLNNGDVLTQTPLQKILMASGVMKNGNDADKAASPVVGQAYAAVDTAILYICFVAGAWVALSGVPQYLVAHRTGTSVPSGWTEETAWRGFVIVGLVGSGTAAGTVGTAFTNVQDKTHTHLGSTAVSLDATAAGGSGTNFSRNTHTHAVTIGNAATSDVLAYIQRLGIIKS